MENFSRDFLLFISSFPTISANFSKFGAGNIILFQIKVFLRNIEETMLARYFIKVSARSSFARLMVIRQKKKKKKKKKKKIIKYQHRKYVTKILLYLLLIETPLIRIRNASLNKSIEVHFNRSKIFLLYFYDAWRQSVKKIGRNTAYSYRTKFSIEFHDFMKRQ